MELLPDGAHYAGNNGQLGFIAYNSFNFTGAAFADFLLDQVSLKGRGSLAEPWTHLQNRVGFFVADDYKIRDNLTINAGLRWGYMSPLVEKDDRQANFDLANAQLLLAGQNGNSRALYNAYYGGWEPRIGAAYRHGDRWVFRGGYGITQFMEGTGANQRLPLNPPYFFESQVPFDRTSGAGTIVDRLRRPASARHAVGPGARVGSEPEAAVHAAVERVRGIPARHEVVDQHRLRRQHVEEPDHDDRREPAARGHGSREHLAAAGAAAAVVPTTTPTSRSR